jgi:hypothetical protein
MSPYMQNVVDAQQRQAIDAARQAQLGGNLAAARQGTYGGARQALLQGQRESGLRTQLGDIQAQGLQRAYEQAQQQFERDRAAQMGVSQQNLAAKLGVQQLSSGQSLEAQRAINKRHYRRDKHGSVQLKVLVDWLRHLVASVLNSLPVSLMFLRLRVRLATFSVRFRSNRWMHNVRRCRIRLSMVRRR